MDPSSQSTPTDATLEHVKVRAGLARLHRAATALFTSRADIALWTDPNWTIDPAPLVSALAADQTLAFAFALPGSGAVLDARRHRIHTNPTHVPAILVRPDALCTTNPPDFGQPDSVLDDATGWVLASVLSLSGLNGLAIHNPTARKSGVRPESIDTLSPVGIAWLITQSQGWARHAATDSPRRASPLAKYPMLEMGALRTGAGR